MLKKLNIKKNSNVIKNIEAEIGNSSMGIVDAASFKNQLLINVKKVNFS